MVCCNGAQTGLVEMTSDISSLVNLQLLVLSSNGLLDRIPESISCLQELQCLVLRDSPIGELPAGLTTLAKLDAIDIRGCTGVHFPRNLRVSGLHCWTLVKDARVCMWPCSL
jgi:Leucine-rich repeat (LRR) protein